MTVEPELRGPSILLLATDGEPTDALSELLSSRAELHCIRTSGDLDALRETHFDALFYFPGSGSQAWRQHLQTIKDWYPDLPVIVLSGAEAYSECAEALEAGAFDFLVPPFGEHRLLAVVEQAKASSEARAWHTPAPDSARAVPCQE